MTTTPLCFTDTETDGVHPGRQPWEVAMIRRDDQGERELEFFVEIDLSTADPFGLQVGRFYERHPQGRILSGRVAGGSHEAFEESKAMLAPWEAAEKLAAFTHGAHIVGAVPSFDTATLDPLLRRHKLIPAWHYHVIDVEAMAVGWLLRDAEVLEFRAAVEKPPADGPWLDLRAEAARLREVATPPYRSDELTAALGLPPVPEELRHTAMGDVQWVMAMYDRMTGATA